MWHLVDARGQVVGRLASQLVRILRGKHKPSYAPHLKNVGDYVVVVNAKYVHFTGRYISITITTTLTTNTTTMQATSTLTRTIHGTQGILVG
jgi:ribosomal protein L13